jgi:hypothetical protein
VKRRDLFSLGLAGALAACGGFPLRRDLDPSLAALIADSALVVKGLKVLAPYAGKADALLPLIAALEPKIAAVGSLAEAKPTVLELASLAQQVLGVLAVLPTPVQPYAAAISVLLPVILAAVDAIGPMLKAPHGQSVEAARSTLRAL